MSICFFSGGNIMKRNKTEDLRLDPEKRLCPQFDSVSIKKFPVNSEETIGMTVVDNCAEEHIM